MAKRRPFSSAALLLAVACAQVSDGSPGEPEPLTWTVEVTVTNTGDGFGSVEVMFPVGTPEEPCPAVLGPGESCSPSVSVEVPIAQVILRARSAEGSEFLGWGGDCAGAEEDCALQVPREPLVRRSVLTPFGIVSEGHEPSLLGSSLAARISARPQEVSCIPKWEPSASTSRSRTLPARVRIGR